MKNTNRIILFAVLCLIIVFVVGCLVTQTEQQVPVAQTKPIVAASEPTAMITTSGNYEIPECNPDLVVKHTAYALLYNEKREQADWVAYKLLKKNLTAGTAERTDKFLVDPKIKTGSATNADYSKSGYDRGHLAPAADMQQSELTMKESFYFSNMSPQTPEFNRGIWKKLEEKVRDWALANDTLYVVTGPVFISVTKEIGPNKVDVPSHYFKALMTIKQGKVHTTGFLLPNKGSKNKLSNYTVTIDSLEKVTAINFFYLLPDNIENSSEKTVSQLFQE